MSAANSEAVAIYGDPPRDLFEVPRSAILQVAPGKPGSGNLEDFEPGSLGRVVMLAPHMTVERRAAMALALRALRPGGELDAMAPKDKGGSRIAKELAGFGCDVSESSKSHHRICQVRRPVVLHGLDEAIQDGAMRHHPNLGLWTQPGLFSWDHIDPGTALLVRTLPRLSGGGADFGCGIGVLARAVLASTEVESLQLIDLDRRAIAAARQNIKDSRARFLWDDIRAGGIPAGSLDFVVMNPPFHDGGSEDKALGQSFIARAAQALKHGGTLWLTANRHLPYEAALSAQFASAALRADREGYKVYEAVR